MKQKMKWLWLIPAVVLLCAAVFVFVFWDSLAIYLAPKTVLTDAITRAVTQLQQRFEADPIWILYQGLDSEGKQTLDFDLESEDPLWGQIRYDMQVQVQPHQVYGEGTAFNGKRDLNLSVYLDTQFMAVSSEDLLRGSYYGICYDSFSQDIRSIPLLTWMLGDSVLDKWDASVQKIQAQLEQDMIYTIPELPNISEAQWKVLMLGLLAAPSKVERSSIPIQEQVLDCHRITYSMSGESVGKLLAQYLPIADESSASVQAVFYLWEKELVRMDFTVTAGEEAYTAVAELGKNSMDDPVSIEISQRHGADRSQLFVEVVTSQEASHYQERISIRKDSQEPLEFSYQRDATTGEMLLIINEGSPVSFVLTPTEDGFRVDSDDFSDLYRALLRQPSAESGSRQLKGSVTVRKGAAFSTPQFKNLDAWSLDDFLVLLEGLGSLIGIRIHG